MDIANANWQGWLAASRVLRGGAFNNNDRNLRCAYRNNNNPINTRKRNNIGFRVVVCVSSHASQLKSNQVFCLYAQVGNAVHSRMTAETANGEIAQSRPGWFLFWTQGACSR